MAEQVLKQSLSAPGFFGLNLQSADEYTDFRFAKEAKNIVFDASGRIAARKGWKTLSPSFGTVNGVAEYGIAQYNIDEYSTPAVRFIYEFIKEGNNIVISASGSSFFTGVSDPVEIYVRNGDNDEDLAYSVSDSNWQVASLPYGEGADIKPHAYFVQAGHEPLVFHELPLDPSQVALVVGSEYNDAEYNVNEYNAAPGTFDSHSHDSGVFGFQRLGDIGTLPLGHNLNSFKPNCTLAAFGRVWMADIEGDRQTIYFSRLLDGSDFQGGDSGFIALNSVFPSYDRIVALGAHNGFLVVFGTNNIAIFANPIDVTRLELQDFIPNVGCAARDTVQNTGTDIIFLSNTGLASLQRVVIEKSLPYRELSKNIRDSIIAATLTEPESGIKGIYSEAEGFYLLSFSSQSKVYCFDTKLPLQDGSLRVTEWDNLQLYSFVVTQDKELLFRTDEHIAKYDGYKDNDQPYTLKYYTNYTDLQQPNNIKILKKLGYTYRGQDTKNFITAWGFDYSEDFSKQAKIVPGGFAYEYNIAEYGVGEYGGGTTKNGQFTVNTSGSGNVVQVGLEAEINGNYLALQKIDIYAKQGKVL
jgi:hypothetical protein